jgi:hypothetical protein
MPWPKGFLPDQGVSPEPAQPEARVRYLPGAEVPTADA